MAARAGTGNRTVTDEPVLETEIPFTGRKLAEMLKESRYETHPKGMVQPFGADFEEGGEGQTIFLDVNAEAVGRAARFLTARFD